MTRTGEESKDRKRQFTLDLVAQSPTARNAVRSATSASA